MIEFDVGSSIVIQCSICSVHVQILEQCLQQTESAVGTGETEKKQQPTLPLKGISNRVNT